MAVGPIVPEILMELSPDQLYNIINKILEKSEKLVNDDYITIQHINAELSRREIQVGR